MKLTKSQLKQVIKEQSAAEEAYQAEISWLRGSGAKLILRASENSGIDVWAFDFGTLSGYGIYLSHSNTSTTHDWEAAFDFAGEDSIRSPVVKSAKKALALLMGKREMKEISGAILKARRALEVG